MRTRSIFSFVVAAAVLLPLSRPAGANAQLPPTPTGDRATPRANSDGSGLGVPERRWTLDNGMLTPHPVIMNGRVLMSEAIRYYRAWKGLADPVGALTVLDDYLFLATLSQNPELMETKPSAYALRFLSEAERGKYACSPSEELKKRGRTGPDAYGACLSGHQNASTGASRLNLGFWVGATEVEQRRTRQAFLDNYGDRLIAAAPRLPIELLEVGYGRFDRYDRTKGGFMVTYSLPGSHRFYGSAGNLILLCYRTNIDGAPAQEWRCPQVSTRYGPISLPLSGLWPIDSAEGQAVISRIPSNGAIPFQYHITLTDLKSASILDYWNAKLRLIAAVVYEDPLLERELYRFKCESLAAC